MGTPDSPDDRAALRRALMDRARELSIGGRARAPRRFWQHAVAVMVALGVVLLILSGFDAFLATVQKVLEIQAADPVPAPTDTMPVFVVEAPVSAPGAAVADGSPDGGQGTPPAAP